jgi:hypothetical protein
MFRGIFRLYAATQGRSNIEPQGLESHPALKSPQAAQHIFLQVFPVGQFLDWYPASRRQYVIILTGDVEIGWMAKVDTGRGRGGVWHD